MKKVTFYKTMYGGENMPPKLEKSIGYQSWFTVTGTDIEISLIFEKQGNLWRITEESSGLKLPGVFDTRAEALNSVNINILQAIKKRLATAGKYINAIEKAKQMEA